MYDIASSTITLIKIIALLAIVCIFLPSRATKALSGSGRFLDTVFYNLVHSTLLIIVISYILKLVNIFEALSVVFSYIIGLFLLHKLNKKNLTIMDYERIPYIVSVIGDSQNISQTVLVILTDSIRRAINLLKTFKNIIIFEMQRSICYSLTIFVFAAIAFFRFKYVITYFNFKSPDLHLLLSSIKVFWENTLFSINNQGFSILLSYISRLTFMDPYWLVRFIEPIAGVLLLLSVFYFCLRTSKNYAFSLSVLAFVALLNSYKINFGLFGNATSISEEFASIFIFPGLYFLLSLIKKPTKINLLYIIETIFVVAAINLKILIYYIIILLLTWVLYSLLYSKYHKKLKLKTEKFLNLIQSSIFRKKYVKYIISVIFIISFSYLIKLGNPIQIPYLEYNTATKAYLSIKENYPIHEWTIVAPTEQRFEALGYGWHYELLTFVNQLSVEKVSDPNFKVSIKSRDIFVYTEKKPLFFNGKLTGDFASMQLKSNYADPYTEIYLVGTERAILEAKAIKIMEAFMLAHKQNVSVFLEDDNMRIYHIQNTGG